MRAGRDRRGRRPIGQPYLRTTAPAAMSRSATLWPRAIGSADRQGRSPALRSRPAQAAAAPPRHRRADRAGADRRLCPPGREALLAASGNRCHIRSRTQPGKALGRAGQFAMTTKAGYDPAEEMVNDRSGRNGNGDGARPSRRSTTSPASPASPRRRSAGSSTARPCSTTRPASASRR